MRTKAIIQISARVFFLASLLAALLLTLYGPQSHADGVGKDGKALGSSADEKPPTPEEAVARFTENITAKANAGQVPTYVGRNEKLQHMHEILIKKGAKSVIIIGDRGAGKTHFVEHLAGQLDGKTIYSLSISTLWAGTQYRGVVEERVKALIQYFKSHRDAILLIDEAVSVVQDGKEDIRNELLPPMARGEITAVLITTEQEFNEKLEKDQALIDRTEVLRFETPTEKDVYTMLRSRKASLSEHYGIGIMDSALRETAKLTIRFFMSNSPMRKALNILEGTLAREKISRTLGNYDNAYMLNEVQETELEIKSLEDDLSRHPHDEELRSQIKEAQEKLGALKERLDEAKGKDRVHKIQEEITGLQRQAAAHRKAGDLQAEAIIQHSTIPALRAEAERLGLQSVEHAGDITPKHIQKYVAQSSGRRMTTVSGTEQERLELARKEAKSRVLFQDHAVDSIINFLETKAANVDKIGPTAILLDGANGVGKTQLTEILSMSVNGVEPIVIDGNQIQGGNAAWELYGSGVGHVDSDKGGKLDPIRGNAEAFVLVDEANLASKSFWEAMYQLLDKGYAKDNRGRIIDARRVTFIFTANFTQEYAANRHIWTNEQIAERFHMNAADLEGLGQNEKDQRVLERAMELKGVPPGMRDRFSAKVLFNSITLEQAVVIARLQLVEQRDYIYREHKVTVNFGESVAEAVAKIGYDPEFNVRPIGRTRKGFVSHLLAKVEGGLKKGDVLHVEFMPSDDGKGGKLVVSRNAVELNSKDVIFKTRTTPGATKAQAAGELGKEVKPGTMDDAVKRAVERSKARK
ncbi:MAG: AAA family ATPase [Bdellovibrionales bacterium]